jgi:hypothetical protein
MPQNSIKNYFLVVLDYLSYKNGPIDLVRGLFSPYFGTFVNLFGSIRGCPNAPKQHEKLFSGCFGPLILQE